MAARWGWSSEIAVLGVLALVVTLAWKMPRPQTPAPFLTRQGAGSMIAGAEGSPESLAMEAARGASTAEDANSITATDTANRASAAVAATFKAPIVRTDAAASREQSNGVLERERQRTAELSKALAQALKHVSNLQVQLATAGTAIGTAQTRNRQASVEDVDTGRGPHRRRLKAQLDVAQRAVAFLQAENARLRERVHGGDIELAAERQRDKAAVAATNGEVAKLKLALNDAARQADRSGEAERNTSNRADILQNKVAGLQARIDIYTIEGALLRASRAVLASSKRAAEAARSVLQADNTRLQLLVAKSDRGRPGLDDGGDVIRAATESTSAAVISKDVGAVEAVHPSPQLKESLRNRAILMTSFAGRGAKPQAYDISLGSGDFAIEPLARHQKLFALPLMDVGRSPDKAFLPWAKCVQLTTQSELADGRWRSKDGILALKGGRFHADTEARACEG